MTNYDKALRDVRISPTWADYAAAERKLIFHMRLDKQEGRRYWPLLRTILHFGIDITRFDRATKTDVPRLINSLEAITALLDGRIPNKNFAKDLLKNRRVRMAVGLPVEI